MQLHSNKAQNQLIELLYQSPRRWRFFLEQLTQLSNARSARMLVLDQQANKVQSSIKFNIDDNDHQQYVEHYVNTCPWRPELSQKPEGKLYSTYLDFSCKQDDYYKTEFFNDWARSQDIHHGVCGTVYQNDKQKIQLLIQRCESQGHFNHTEKKALNALVPHLRGVITMQLQFEVHESRLGAISQAHQVSAMPLIMLDQALRVNYISSNAERLLGKHADLIIRNQRLIVDSDLATRRHFEKLLTECVTSASGEWHRSGGWVPVKRSQGGSFGLMVMPMHPEADQFCFSSVKTFAAVFIYGLDSSCTLCKETLNVIYNITSAEAELLGALVKGETLESYALCRKRSVYTLKAQLRSLFRKTDTCRQLELVCKILNGPACLGRLQPEFSL